MPRIYITEPNHFYTFELPTAPGAEVLIGTAPHCQLALPGVAGLGEVHACISCQPQGYVLSDMGSPTGTFANGVPIRSEYLMPGVEYRMGAAVITLAAEGMPPMQQPMAAAQPAVPQQAAPQQAAPAPQQGAAAPAAKKKSPLKTGAAAKSGATKQPAKGGKNNLADMAARFDRNRGQGAAKMKFIYVVVLLAIAFYAGIALHHFERTGNCLPGLVADEQDPPTVAPATHAAPAEPAEPAEPEATPAADDTDTPAADDTPAEDDTTPAEDSTDDEPADDEPTSTPEPEGDEE